MFSLALRRSLLRAQHKLIQQSGIHLDALSYVDDTLICIEIDHIAAAWPVLRLELAQAGLTINESKCVGWSPSLTTKDFCITNFIEQSLEGIPLLGNAVQSSTNALWGSLV